MSEVKVHLAGYLAEGEHVVLQPAYDSLKFDFDRVTAERDAALGREAALREELAKAKKETIYKHAALVSKAKALTAADDRVDVLEGLLRKLWNVVSNGYKSDIDAALKPAGG